MPKLSLSCLKTKIGKILLHKNRNLYPLPNLVELPPRVILATQPKAGTYLYSSLLAGLGFEQTYFHLSNDKMQAYDKNTPNLNTNQPRIFDCYIPLVESRRLVRSGQFAVSHLVPTGNVADLLEEFKIIAINRELRAGITSFAKFIISTGRGDNSPDLRDRILNEGIAAFLERKGASYIKKAIMISKWKIYKNIKKCNVNQF